MTSRRLLAPRVRAYRPSDMCLGIPGLVIDITRDEELLMGSVQFGGIRKRVCLEHVPDVKIGDYVLVHVGFALTRIDEAEAHRVFALLRELDQLDEITP